MTLRLGLAAAALLSSFSMPAPAGAACTPNTPPAQACYAARPFVTACVNTGSSCTPVTVIAPLCVYGRIGDAVYFTTVWC